MEDDQIIQLSFGRSVDAISQTAVKYGKNCHTIAYNILVMDGMDASRNMMLVCFPKATPP